MTYVNFSDILRRSVYTKQGLVKMAGRADFPAPAFTVGDGKIRIWRLDDIEVFEKTHPELTSEGAKLRKVSGFRKARERGGMGRE